VNRLENLQPQTPSERNTWWRKQIPGVVEYPNFNSFYSLKRKDSRLFQQQESKCFRKYEFSEIETDSIGPKTNEKVNACTQTDLIVDIEHGHTLVNLVKCVGTDSCDQVSVAVGPEPEVMEAAATPLDQGEESGYCTVIRVQKRNVEGLNPEEKKGILATESLMESVFNQSSHDVTVTINAMKTVIKYILEVGLEEDDIIYLESIDQIPGLLDNLKTQYHAQSLDTG
jgi:hypothetical protein